MGQIWLERLLRWNAKIQKLLVGRYARMDQLNNTLMKISLILLLLNLFLPTSIAFWLAVVLLIWINYRFFSKRIYPRSNENTRYVANMQQLKKKFNNIKQRVYARKTYTFFKCPNCKQQLRAPKGKGKIKVNCSTCKEQFTKTV
ncbi:hypothetical protein UAY_02287 [Enterococcus moraviensis ATCC BAA-383]|uniref:Zn-finger containing protein n=1 Tax=Enterococcus moraviensis ATCC BAA-383 TaxID=1158609 RepID=R2QUM9_9ENTE|nr:hypothetical protein [Enterococcus moraviensis]EOH99018.1 hypothetical protein UAY_02287 [Enterococcus moraviensis ATCC BAA-383]EOT71807.1 hypothetical protein I586_01614 [Enterococcus moraviensis ATCC BAA-383]OJG67925.1 hypothetical protein RV09_GL002036 [Enterococcus moraviensis]